MLNYDDIGRNGDEFLVLVHGLGGTRNMWEPQYELSKHLRIIIPELRGHGESKEKDKLYIKQFAEDVIELLNKLNIRKAHFCGLSLGGIVVQEIFRSYKSRVKSLILANTISYIPIAIGDYAATQREEVLNNSTDEEFISKTVLACLSEENTYLKKEAEKAFKMNRDTYTKCARSSIGANFISMLPFIDVPVLIFGGDKDKVTQVLNQRFMHSMIPDSKLVIFENTGHLSNLESKEEFNNEVLDFLMSC